MLFPEGTCRKAKDHTLTSSLIVAVTVLFISCAVPEPSRVPTPSTKPPPPSEDLTIQAEEEVFKETIILRAPVKTAEPIKDGETGEVTELSPTMKTESSPTESPMPPRLAKYELIKEEAFLTRGRLAEFIAHLAESDGKKESPQGVIVTDILEHPAREEIIEVVSQGYMEIFPNHRFKPEALVSRAEMAGSLWLLIEGGHTKSPEMPLQETITDLPPTNRYYKAIRAIISMGVMNLESGGKFRPTRPVTGKEAWEAMSRLSDYLFGREG